MEKVHEFEALDTRYTLTVFKGCSIVMNQELFGKDWVAYGSLESRY